MELRLRRSHCNVHVIRDLLVPVAFHVVQHEHHAGLFRQVGDGALEVDALAGGVAPATAHRLDQLEHVGAAFVLRSIPLLSHAHQHLIHRQPVQPRREHRFGLQERELFPRVDEHILC